MASKVIFDQIEAATAGGNVEVLSPLHYAGGVVQVQQHVFQGTTTSTSGSVFVDTGLSVSITPKFATSKILVSYNITCGTKYWIVQFRLQRDGVDLTESFGTPVGNRRGVTSAVKVYSGNTTNQNRDLYNTTASFLDSPATVSPIVYSVQFAGFSTSYYVYINRSEFDSNSVAYDPRTASTITVMEIAQ